MSVLLPPLAVPAAAHLARLSPTCIAGPDNPVAALASVAAALDAPAATDLTALPAALPSALPVALLALAGVFCLSRFLANARVGAAVALCLGSYPIFVAEVSAASASILATAATAWGLFFYFTSLRSGRGDAGRAGVVRGPGGLRAYSIGLFALASLAQAAAAVTPAALCAWELLGRAARPDDSGGDAGGHFPVGRRPVVWSLSLLLALAPPAVVLAYTRATTGAAFAPAAAVSGGGGAAGFLAAACAHLYHFTAHAGLWALTLAGGAAMFLRPRREGEAERPRIAVSAQLAVAALVAAHVALLPLFGAFAARDALPALPPVILVWVSTLWRRVPVWPLAVALVCAVFFYHLR